MLETSYFLSQVISTLAQYTSSFASKRYIPSEHPRIISYLRVRSRLTGTPLPAFLQAPLSEPRPTRENVSLKRKREHPTTQRSCSYLADMESESYAMADTPVPGFGGTPKGKMKGKLSPKGKSKGKGKSKDKGKTHATFTPWKGSGKGKGKIPFKGSRGGPPILQGHVSGPQRLTDNSSTTKTPHAAGASSAYSLSLLP